MANCPLCSDILLRHIRSGKTYWLCRDCRIELLEDVQKIQYHSASGLETSLPPLPRFASVPRASISKPEDLFSPTVSKPDPIDQLTH